MEDTVRDIQQKLAVYDIEQKHRPNQLREALKEMLMDECVASLEQHFMAVDPIQKWTLKEKNPYIPEEEWMEYGKNEKRKIVIKIRDSTIAFIDDKDPVRIITLRNRTADTLGSSDDVDYKSLLHHNCNLVDIVEAMKPEGIVDLDATSLSQNHIWIARIWWALWMMETVKWVKAIVEAKEEELGL